MSGPEQVAEQLPASHPGRPAALEFVRRYEEKFGADSRTQFAAHTYDVSLVLEKVVPIALKRAKPGSPEFRAALRDALETSGGIPTTKGVLNYTPTDHWGYGPDARALVVYRAGQWQLEKR
jgi:branched-chain amino acid transport system substrate-binding protein